MKVYHLKGACPYHLPYLMLFLELVMLIWVHCGVTWPAAKHLAHLPPSLSVMEGENQEN